MQVFKLFYSTVKKNLFLIIIALICTGIVTYINLSIPFLNQIIIDEAIGKSNIDLLNVLIVALLFFSFLEYLLNIIETYLFTKVAKRFTNSIYNQIIDNLLLKNHDFFIYNASGEIVGRISEAWDLEELFSPQLFSSIFSMVTLIGATFILFKISPIVTIITFIGTALSVFFIFLNNKFIQKYLPKALNKKIDVNSKIQEIILGIFEIRAHLSNQLFAKRCKTSIKEKCDFSIIFSTVINILLKSSTLVSTLMMVIVLYVFGQKIIINEFTIGTYFLIISYMQKIIDPVMNISTFINQIKPIIITAQRIEEKFSLTSEDHVSAKFISKNNDVNCLIVKNISYLYKNNSDYTFLNFNLTAQKGEVILIQGQNGAGKTTLLNVLCGELKSASGEILFDGKIGIPQNYVSIVKQKPYIFNMSVKDNIVLNESFSKKRYFDILNSLCFDKYFDLDTLKSKKITNESISGGQIKLIALARCLYRDKPILIFDEVFSNLDVNLKYNLKKYIKNHKSEHIIISVEHSNELEGFVDKVINLK